MPPRKRAPARKAAAAKPAPSPAAVDAEELLSHLSALVFDDIFWMQDLQSGQTLYVSPSCERTFGVTREAMLADSRAWVNQVVPEDREKVLDALRAREYQEFQVRLRHGEGVHWIRCRTFPVHDPGGGGMPYRLVGVAEDITSRRQTEDALRQSQAELLQAQKLEAIGRLAGGVAHDFNNVLTVIMGYSDYILEQMKPEERFRQEIEQVKRAGERAASLTRQMLAFSRKQRLNPRLHAVNTIVTDMEKMLRRLIGDDIEVTLALAPELPPVRVDAGQLEQVLMNLCVNARDAMENGGKLSVETALAELAAERRVGRLCVPPGRYVRLAVRDTGCGMDAGILNKIFEPFFTTKEAGKGTGLGLATTMGIVTQSGGHILVESEKGRGAVFHVYLPADTGPVELAPLVEGPGKNLRGSETVLLLEDEKPVRELLSRTLAEAGYRVLEAGGPGEALWLTERHHGVIHLLVSDIVMRQMSGYDVAERLEVVMPAMKMLFMSGYSERPVPERWAQVPFLAKPFAPVAFLEAVRSALDAPKPDTEPKSA